MDIRNKIVVITGGAGGIGLCTVRALLKCHAQYVALLDQISSRGAEEVKKLASEFGSNRIGFYPCDVSISEEYKATFQKIVEHQGHVDILMNNAGILDDKQPEKTIDINVKSVIIGTLCAIDHMGKHKGGHGGTVVNTASIYGLVTPSILPIYATSKNAVVAFTRSMKEHYKVTGVRIMGVCPGVTNTNLVADIYSHVLDFETKEALNKTFSALPVQQVQTVADSFIKIIKEGENGAVWVVEDSQPPYHVKDPEHYSKRALQL